MERRKDYFGDLHPSYAERALILKAARIFTSEGRYTDEPLALLNEIPDEVIRTYIFTYAPPTLVPELKGYFMERNLPTIKAVLSDVIDPDFTADVEAFTADAERGVDLFGEFLDALGESQHIESLPVIYAHLISGHDVEIGTSETLDGPTVGIRKIDGHIAQRRAAIAATCAVYPTIEALDDALTICNFRIGA